MRRPERTHADGTSRLGSTVAALIVVALLAACGGDEDPADDASVPGAEPDTEAIDEDDGDWREGFDEEGGSLITEEMRAQMEEAAADAAAAAADAAADDSAPDVQAPGSVTVSGDLQGSYAGLSRCEAFGDSVSVAFGSLRAPFDWSTAVPQIPGGVGVMLEVGGFSGAGTHAANLYLGSANEVVATGEGEITLEFGELIEFPTYSLQVISGTFDGTWAAVSDFPEVGSGSVSGDIGVCSVRAD